MATVVLPFVEEEGQQPERQGEAGNETGSDGDRDGDGESKTQLQALKQEMENNELQYSQKRAMFMKLYQQKEGILGLKKFTISLSI